MKKKICSFTTWANFKKPVSSANDLLKWRVTEVRTALQWTKVLRERDSLYENKNPQSNFKSHMTEILL